MKMYGRPRFFMYPEGDTGLAGAGKADDAKKDTKPEPNQLEGKVIPFKGDDGKLEYLTAEEMQERVEHLRGKAKGGDAAMRQSAEERKRLQYFESMASDLELARGKGPKAKEALMRLPMYKELALDRDAMEEAARLLEEEQEGDDDTPKRGATKKATPRKLTEEDLPDSVKARLAKADAKEREEEALRITEELNDTLDNDPVLGEILLEEGKARVAKRARDFAKNRIIERATEAQRRGQKLFPGPQLYKSIAQDVRGFMADLGYLDVEETEDSTAGRKRTSIPGVGRSPSGGGNVSTRQGKEIERPNSRESGTYKGYLQQRLTQAAKSRRD